MQFTNYTDFRTAVLKMIDGDDVSASFSIDTLDLLIALGESRVYHGDESVAGLRCRDMEATLSLTVTANAATLPDDCIALKRVQFSGEKPLDYISEDDALRHLDNGSGGTARYYTQQGNTILFYPSATGTVGGRYYQRPADIKTGGLHATFNRYPEAFLFAALSEAAPFIGEDSRLGMWKALWSGWMQSAAMTERTAVQSGGRLMVRTR